MQLILFMKINTYSAIFKCIDKHFAEYPTMYTSYKYCTRVTCEVINILTLIFIINRN